MSLINDMLRNIEANFPADPARQNLQREIRSLPAAPSGPGRRLKLLVLVVLPLAGAAVLHANGLLLPMLGIETPPVVSPSSVPQPVPSPAPENVATMETTAGPEGDRKKQPVFDYDLRLAPNLAVLPTPAASVLPVPDPVVLPVAVIGLPDGQMGRTPAGAGPAQGKVRRLGD